MVLDVDLDQILTEFWHWGGKKLKLEKKTFFIRIFKVKLPSLNLFFSGPKNQNDKVSVLIGKIMACM